MCTVRSYLTEKYLSNVKHLEEIREAGLEAPSVNQIEVKFRLLR